MIKNERIFNILNDTIKPNRETSWEEIVTAVKAKEPIDNWYTVRDVLQFMIDERKLVKRTDSIVVEHYVRR